ncbi:MAG: hypothetical protein LBC12_03240 [Nitrososphaerota archaeon]|jgi:hypothetical protein|nr:hypothetical protein [Nitrososphaerota archaeon]
MNKKYLVCNVVVLSMVLFAALFAAVPFVNAETDEGCCNCWVYVTGSGTSAGGGWYTNVWIYAEHGCYWSTVTYQDFTAVIFFGMPLGTNPIPNQFHSGYQTGPYKDGDVWIHAWQWFSCPSGYTYCDDSWSL